MRLWIPLDAWHRRSDTDASRLIRQAIHEQTELGDGFDEHHMVVVVIELLERRKARQVRSRTGIYSLMGTLEAELVGPVLAFGWQAKSWSGSKRWCTDGEEPGCWITITEHEETT